jgi:DASS family divalent anion:Na+ symporter
VVLLAAYLLVQRLAVRGVERAEVPRELVVAQLRLLGGLKRREWAGIAGIAFFIVGILTYSLHAIPPPWLGLTILDGLLLCGFLTRKEFREQVDWTFLAYLAGVVGIVNVVEHVGLGAMLAGHLAPIGAWMRQDLATFFIMLAGLVFVMRLIVPIPATIVLLAVTFMPIAASAGVNQWVVGFAILMLGEMWFLPYQCSYYLQFQEMCLRRSAYDERRLLWCNAWMNVAKLVALVASLPYWRALGLIP